ncbi:MAG: 4-(cytidine 5'-diphospho)-2-C-methyl-D-erythritol kinase [Sphingomicrobium sp.]
MSEFTEAAFAKLNLALHVRRRRADGYHDIETVFAFCEDGDALSGAVADALSVTVSGPFAEAVPAGDDSLVLRAARALRDAAGSSGGNSGGARLHLVKNLPVAAGVGGGSADGAAALRLLTRLWRLPVELAGQIAPKLGADVPACLVSRTSRGTSAGDALEPEDDPSLAGTPVLLVNPGRPLSTGAVFERWDGRDGGPLGEWRDGGNDLERAALTLVPEIAELLDWLRGRPGAEVARMSGSGATCFGLFASEAARDAAAGAVPSGWWHLATRLR